MHIYIYIQSLGFPGQGCYNSPLLIEISSRNFNILIVWVYYLDFNYVEHSDASADRRSAVSLSPVLLWILVLYARTTCQLPFKASI